MPKSSAVSKSSQHSKRLSTVTEKADAPTAAQTKKSTSKTGAAKSAVSDEEEFESIAALVASLHMPQTFEELLQSENSYVCFFLLESGGGGGGGGVGGL